MVFLTKKVKLLKYGGLSSPLLTREGIIYFNYSQMRKFSKGTLVRLWVYGKSSFLIK